MFPSASHRLRQDTVLARPHQLVAPAALAALLDDGVRAPLLIEVGCGDAERFTEGHIAGAAYLDASALETGPLFNKVPDADLLALLLSHGVRRDTPVLLYGRSTLAAARAAHLMLYAGVRDVRLLDGGLACWLGAGLPCARGAGRTPVAVGAFGARFPGRPQYLVERRQARSMLAQADATLVSVRTWDEFTGVTSGYSYIEARGDIPGSRWGRAGRQGDVNSMSDYQLADGRMRPAAEIERMWRAAGIHAGQRTAFYCGTGWRASLAFYYAWLMGWERIAVYDGGWYEWSADPANPVVCRIAESICA